MGVDDIGAPLFGDLDGPADERADFPYLSDRRAPWGGFVGPAEGQPFFFGRIGRGFIVARACDAEHVPTHRDLRLQDSARTKSIAAVDGKAMIKDVEDLHAGPKRA